MRQQQEQKAEPQGHQKGVVALLQEFVQCSRQFSAPQHRPILQWNYDSRMINGTFLEFRGTVAFLLDGLPHHVAGGWQPSKKLAQRDVAERSLVFFVGRWGEQLLDEQAGNSKVPEVSKDVSDVEALNEFCRTYAPCGSIPPQWSHSYDGSGFIAQVQIHLMGVPHKIAGASKLNKQAAYTDTARRVLWYFQCPGYQSKFAPDPHAPAVNGKEIPNPPKNWASDDAEIAELKQTARKTVLMRVQNRLQQEFAKQLKPGQSVWDWSYEMDEKDTVWPPLCRARVEVAAIGQTFVGDWARGQRDAQIEASYLVGEFLDRCSGACSEGSGSPSCEGSGKQALKRMGSGCSARSEATSASAGERAGRWADMDDEDQ